MNIQEKPALPKVVHDQFLWGCHSCRDCLKKNILVAALMLREGVRRNWKQIVLMDG